MGTSHMGDTVFVEGLATAEGEFGVEEMEQRLGPWFEVTVFVNSDLRGDNGDGSRQAPGPLAPRPESSSGHSQS